MPRLKKDTIVYSLPKRLGTVKFDVVYHVNTAGEFYCEIPDIVLPAFSENKSYGLAYSKNNRKGNLCLYSKDLESIELTLKQAIKSMNEPEVTKEHVICYNIESHVSFAETPSGDIYPNSGCHPDAAWANESKTKMFGDHHSNNAASGGYSLCIGAKAMTKITTRIGSKVDVSYEMYYQGKSHLGFENAAQKLNSWCSFALPNKFKEIPYTDEAAMFFYNLMHSMAILSRSIQNATFEQDMLLQLIQSGADNLLLAPKKEQE